MVWMSKEKDGGLVVNGTALIRFSLRKVSIGAIGLNIEANVSEHA